MFLGVDRITVATTGAAFDFNTSCCVTVGSDLALEFFESAQGNRNSSVKIVVVKFERVQSRELFELRRDVSRKNVAAEVRHPEFRELFDFGRNGSVERVSI